MSWTGDRDSFGIFLGSFDEKSKSFPSRFAVFVDLTGSVLYR